MRLATLRRMKARRVRLVKRPYRDLVVVLECHGNWRTSLVLLVLVLVPVFRQPLDRAPSSIHVSMPTLILIHCS